MNEATVDVAETLEELAKARIAHHLTMVGKKLTADIQQIVSTELEALFECSPDDAIWNYRSHLRMCLTRDAAGWAKEDGIWGKHMRDAIFAEHKDEILPLILNDQLDEALKEIESLKKHLKFARRES